MKVNVTAYFHTIQNKQEWKDAMEQQTDTLLPKMKHTIEDLRYNDLAARIIYYPGKTYKAVVSSNKSETSILFTDYDTDETVTITYNNFDPNFTELEVKSYE